jgi:isopentenyl-diphosphate delta-isomerase
MTDVSPMFVEPSPVPADLSGELVVLVDDGGAAIGVAPKASVHGADTPRHLAFSCYVIDAGGRLLVSRRATTKPTFPGVLTNSLCGHPGPGESLPDAVCRRAGSELGLDLAGLPIQLVLPQFSYRAEMDGVVENEACPVFVVTVPDGIPLAPDADEVASVEWMPWADYRDRVLDGSLQVSSWSTDQVRQLVALGADPATWPEAPASDLPPAAQPHPAG